MIADVRPLHVMAIDDDEDDLRVLKRSLRAAGNWEVEFTGHTKAQGAIDCLNGRACDVIFLDYLLGAETGLDVLRKIRKKDALRPVIVMTGKGDEYLAVEMIRNGANGYLAKSDMTPDTLRNVVEGAIRERKLEDEKRVLEQKLRESQKLEAVGTLAGGIAHDFNNILAGILGEVELALLQSDGSPAKPHLESIGRSCHRMGDIIRRLLSFSRRSDEDLGVVDVNEAITELKVILDHTLPKNISIQAKFHTEHAWIRGTNSGIEQVFLNLCTNARDAMPRGGTIRIDVEKVKRGDPRLAHFASVEGEEFILTQVTDTGEGIEEEIIDRIFEPFFTTKDLGPQKGTGLGLAIAWQIIAEYGGKIGFKSVVGSGTTVSVLFQYATTTRVVPQPPMAPRLLPKGGETILVVDDEPTLRDVIARMLGYLGYRVVSAADGATALQLARNHKAELAAAIIDVSMPGLSGVECCRQLRRICPKVAIIFASGHDLESRRVELEAEGAGQILQKPFQLAEIAVQVRNVIDARNGKNGDFGGLQ